MSECINHLGAVSDGYGVKKHKGKLVRAHRLSYCQSKNINMSDIEGLIILHLCDNRLCINPEHLRAGTHADNCADKLSKNRQARGEKIGNAKLTDEDVKSIKKMLKNGRSRKYIARLFSVSSMCIGRIASGKTWRHI